MTHLLFIAALLAYLVATLCYLMVVGLRRESFGEKARRALVVAFLLHSGALVWFFGSGHAVRLNTRQDYFFWMAWALPALFLLLRRKFDFPITGAFIAPTSLLLLTSSSWLVHYAPLTTAPLDIFLLVAHAFPAFVAEMALVYAFILSMVFLIQSKRLKKKSLDRLVLGGPNLASLERLIEQAAEIGFLSMGVAIMTGAVWAVSQSKPLLSGDVFQWLAILGWIGLAGVLHARTHLGWSGANLSRLVGWCSGLFLAALVLVTLFGGNVFHGGSATPI